MKYLLLLAFIIYCNAGLAQHFGSNIYIQPSIGYHKDIDSSLTIFSTHIIEERTLGMSLSTNINQHLIFGIRMDRVHLVENKKFINAWNFYGFSFQYFFMHYEKRFNLALNNNWRFTKTRFIYPYPYNEKSNWTGYFGLSPLLYFAPIKQLPHIKLFCGINFSYPMVKNWFSRGISEQNYPYYGLLWHLNERSK